MLLLGMAKKYVLLGVRIKLGLGLEKIGLRLGRR